MKLTTKIALIILKRKDLPLEDKTALSTALLENFDIRQFTDVLKIDEQGNVLVNGKSVDMELARKMRESAKYTLDSTVRKLVRDQVDILAINLGVHNGDTPEKILFSRTALWWGQQEDELYKLLAQE